MSTIRSSGHAASDESASERPNIMRLRIPAIGSRLRTMGGQLAAARGIGGGKNLRASLQNMIPSGENLLRRTPFDQGRVGWLRKLRHTRRLILSNCLLRRDFLERGQFGGTVDLQPAKTILSDTAGCVPSSEKPSARISRSTKETKE